MPSYTRRASKPDRPNKSLIPSRHLLIGRKAVHRHCIGTVVHPHRSLVPMADLYEFQHESQEQDDLSEHERRAEESMGTIEAGWRPCWIIPARRSTLSSLFETPSDVYLNRVLFSDGGEWKLLNGKDIMIDSVHTECASRSNRRLNHIAFGRMRML